MAEDAPEIRSWLTDVLARRVRRPALEETIFHQLDELERGPLEQLASLVHTAIDELQVARRRLDEQARDVRALRGTIAELTERVDALAAAAAAPEPEPEPEPVQGHVLMLSAPDGYRVVQVSGPPPAPGEALDVDGTAYRVLNRRRSPFPGDRRPCALLLPYRGWASPDSETGASGESASAV